MEGQGMDMDGDQSGRGQQLTVPASIQAEDRHELEDRHPPARGRGRGSRGPRGVGARGTRSSGGRAPRGRGMVRRPIGASGLMRARGEEGARLLMLASGIPVEEEVEIEILDERDVVPRMEGSGGPLMNMGEERGEVIAVQPPPPTPPASASTSTAPPGSDGRVDDPYQLRIYSPSVPRIPVQMQAASSSILARQGVQAQPRPVHQRQREPPVAQRLYTAKEHMDFLNEFASRPQRQPKSDLKALKSPEPKLAIQTHQQQQQLPNMSSQEDQLPQQRHHQPPQQLSSQRQILPSQQHHQPQQQLQQLSSQRQILPSQQQQQQHQLLQQQLQRLPSQHQSPLQQQLLPERQKQQQLQHLSPQHLPSQRLPPQYQSPPQQHHQPQQQLQQLSSQRQILPSQQHHQPQQQLQQLSSQRQILPSQQHHQPQQQLQQLLSQRQILPSQQQQQHQHLLLQQSQQLSPQYQLLSSQQQQLSPEQQKHPQLQHLSPQHLTSQRQLQAFHASTRPQPSRSVIDQEAPTVTTQKPIHVPLTLQQAPHQQQIQTPDTNRRTRLEMSPAMSAPSLAQRECPMQTVQHQQRAVHVPQPPRQQRVDERNMMHRIAVQSSSPYARQGTVHVPQLRGSPISHAEDGSRGTPLPSGSVFTCGPPQQYLTSDDIMSRYYEAERGANSPLDVLATLAAKESENNSAATSKVNSAATSALNTPQQMSPPTREESESLDSEWIDELPITKEVFAEDYEHVDMTEQVEEDHHMENEMGGMHEERQQQESSGSSMIQKEDPTHEVNPRGTSSESSMLQEQDPRYKVYRRDAFGPSVIWDGFPRPKLYPRFEPSEIKWIKTPDGAVTPIGPWTKDMTLRQPDPKHKVYPRGTSSGASMMQEQDPRYKVYRRDAFGPSVIWDGFPRPKLYPRSPQSSEVKWIKTPEGAVETVGLFTKLEFDRSKIQSTPEDTFMKRTPEEIKAWLEKQPSWALNAPTPRFRKKVPPEIQKYQNLGLYVPSVLDHDFYHPKRGFGPKRMMSSKDESEESTRMQKVRNKSKKSDAPRKHHQNMEQQEGEDESMEDIDESFEMERLEHIEKEVLEKSIQKQMNDNGAFHDEINDQPSSKPQEVPEDFKSQGDLLCTHHREYKILNCQTAPTNLPGTSDQSIHVTNEMVDNSTYQKPIKVFQYGGYQQQPSNYYESVPENTMEYIHNEQITNTAFDQSSQDAESHGFDMRSTSERSPVSESSFAQASSSSPIDVVTVSPESNNRLGGNVVQYSPVIPEESFTAHRFEAEFEEEDEDIEVEDHEEEYHTEEIEEAQQKQQQPVYEADQPVYQADQERDRKDIQPEQKSKRMSKRSMPEVSSAVQHAAPEIRLRKRRFDLENALQDGGAQASSSNATSTSREAYNTSAPQSPPRKKRGPQSAEVPDPNSLPVVKTMKRRITEVNQHSEEAEESIARAEGGAVNTMRCDMIDSTIDHRINDPSPPKRRGRPPKKNRKSETISTLEPLDTEAIVAEPEREHSTPSNVSEEIGIVGWDSLTTEQTSITPEPTLETVPTSTATSATTSSQDNEFSTPRESRNNPPFTDTKTSSSADLPPRNRRKKKDYSPTPTGSSRKLVKPEEQQQEAAAKTEEKIGKRREDGDVESTAAVEPLPDDQLPQAAEPETTPSIMTLSKTELRPPSTEPGRIHSSDIDSPQVSRARTEQNQATVEPSTSSSAPVVASMDIFALNGKGKKKPIPSAVMIGSPAQSTSAINRTSDDEEEGEEQLLLREETPRPSNPANDMKRILLNSFLAKRYPDTYNKQKQYKKPKTPIQTPAPVPKPARISLPIPKLKETKDIPDLTMATMSTFYKAEEKIVSKEQEDLQSAEQARKEKKAESYIQTPQRKSHAMPKLKEADDIPENGRDNALHLQLDDQEVARRVREEKEKAASKEREELKAAEQARKERKTESYIPTPPPKRKSHAMPMLKEAEDIPESERDNALQFYDKKVKRRKREEKEKAKEREELKAAEQARKEKEAEDPPETSMTKKKDDGKIPKQGDGTRKRK